MADFPRLRQVREIDGVAGVGAGGGEAAGVRGAEPAEAGSDRATHGREPAQIPVAAVIPVCIRKAGADDDVSTSLDISHGGMRLTSSRYYPQGTYIKVAVPYSSTAVNVFVDARVVHISQAPTQEGYQLGVMYLVENNRRRKADPGARLPISMTCAGYCWWLSGGAEPKGVSIPRWAARNAVGKAAAVKRAA